MSEISLDLLREKLPGQIFLSLHQILSPRNYLQESDWNKLRDENFLFDYLDSNLSVLFNFVNDLIYGDIDAKNVIKNQIDEKEPYLLYLRDFSITNEHYNYYGAEKLYSIGNTITGLDVQSLLFRLNIKNNFIIGIRNIHGLTSKIVPMLQGEIPALLIHDDSWQSIAEELIRGANGIILHLSTLGNGSSFEIDCIRKHKRQNNCLLIFEPENLSGESLLTEVFGLEVAKVSEDRSDKRLKIINEMLSEFENNMVYSSDSEWSGYIDLYERILNLRNEMEVADVDKLQKIVDSSISLSGVLGKEIEDLIDRLLEINNLNLSKKGFDNNSIQALYVDASLHFLSGRFGDCVSKFSMIAFYAEKILTKNPELALRLKSFNLGRSASSIYWITEDISSDEARIKAVELFKTLEGK